MNGFLIALCVLAGIILLVLILALIFACFILKRKSPLSSKNITVDKLVNDKNFLQFKDELIFYQNNGEKVLKKMRDGKTMAGKLFKKEGATKTIIMCHGYRGNPEVCFAPMMKYLNNLNANILYIEQRAHGNSEGNTITMGYLERDDLHEWVDYVLETTNTDIYLWGVSMGCATILFSLYKKYDARVKGVIADCGYRNVYIQYYDVGKGAAGKFIGSIVVSLLGIWYRLIVKTSIKALDTRETIADADIPILFVHGKNDNFVLVHNTLENYESYKGKKDLLLVDGASHIESFKVLPEKYIKRISNLFDLK